MGVSRCKVILDLSRYSNNITTVLWVGLG